VRRIATVVSIVVAFVLWVPPASYAAASGRHPQVPASVHRVTVTKQRNGRLQRRGAVTGIGAQQLVDAVDRLTAYPKHAVFDCPGHVTGDGPPVFRAVFRATGHVWVMKDASCGLRLIKDGGPQRAYRSSKAYRSAFHAALSQVRSTRADVPPSLRRVVLTKRNHLPSQVVRHGAVHGAPAARLVRAYNQLQPPSPDISYDCAADTGLRETAVFRAGGHVWRATVGRECGLVSVTRDGSRLPSFADTVGFDHALRHGYAQLRPRSEHVPASVHKAEVSYRQTPSAPATKRRTVRGAKARALVHTFDHLKREPNNYVICDIAGGPLETIVFRTATHDWTVEQSPCSEVQVKRDDKALPTLLSDAQWSKAVAAAIGH
jgi:hypothetical protein